MPILSIFFLLALNRITTANFPKLNLIDTNFQTSWSGRFSRALLIHSAFVQQDDNTNYKKLHSFCEVEFDSILPVISSSNILRRPQKFEPYFSWKNWDHFLSNPQEYKKYEIVAFLGFGGLVCLRRLWMAPIKVRSF